MTLDELGPRLCILGPSNSGKSTLADAVARARDLPPIHLDQLHHLPNTDWRPRPPQEFVALHDAAIARERWVVDGNYSGCLPQRLARATGVVLLDVSTWTSLRRYLRRSLFEHGRKGGLEGGKDRIKMEMIHYIVFAGRTQRRRCDALFDSIALPKLRLASKREIAHFYRVEGLGR